MGYWFIVFLPVYVLQSYAKDLHQMNTQIQSKEVAKVICDLIADNECCLDGQNIVIRKRNPKQTK